jgi:hypothetical protein
VLISLVIDLEIPDAGSLGGLEEIVSMKTHRSQPEIKKCAARRPVRNKPQSEEGRRSLVARHVPTSCSMLLVVSPFFPLQNMLEK